MPYSSLFDVPHVLLTEKLDEEARKLRLAEALVGVGHWSASFDTGEVVWSDEVYRICGMDPSAGPPSFADVVAVYHPDDREVLTECIARAKEFGEGYEFKLRITRLNDGEQRIVATKAQVDLDSRGVPEQLFGVFQDVTDQQQAREKLEQSEALYRALADNASDVIARYKPDGEFLYLSSAVERIVGYSPEELLGKSTFSLMHPDDHERVQRVFKDYLGSGPDAPPVNVEYRARHRDGHTVWIEAHSHALRRDDGSILEFHDVSRDVTAKKEAEAEAKAAVERALNSEALYRLLAERSMDVILKVGPDGVIHYCSPASRQFGYEPEEIAGRNMGDLVHPDDLPSLGAALNALFGQMLPNNALTHQQRVRTAGRDWVWVEGNSSLVFDATGEPSEAVTVLRDVTARRALEEDLRRAKDEAEAAANTKSEFLANMSHELRTPLTSVLGFAGLLRNMPGLPDDANRYVQRIGSSSSALLSLINDVLDFSKLDSGQVTLDPSRTDPAELVGEICDLLGVQSSAKGLRLRHEVSPDAALPIDIDDVRLRQVLNNLIGNAVKFTGQGGVDVEMSILDGPNRTLLVSISDTGPGMTPDQQANLFRRFSQADTSITRSFGGSGLGLSICRQLVELMGGVIGVESEPGAGSRFWFTVPAPLSLGSGAAEPIATVSGDIFTGRVLVVDDHPVNRELVKALLGDLDLEMHEACSGLEAIEACLGTAFDLILMDVQMPEMDGLTATRTIRSTCAANARTPIIALTAMMVSERRAELMAAGMNDCVTKPIDPAMLFAKLGLWLHSANEDFTEAADPGVATYTQR